MLDNSGTYQIGLAQADGSGEQTPTSGQTYDLEQPDFSADGVSVFCTRAVSLNSEIGVVDAQQGRHEAVTDTSGRLMRTLMNQTARPGQYREV